MDRPMVKYLGILGSGATPDQMLTIFYKALQYQFVTFIEKLAYLCCSGPILLRGCGQSDCFRQPFFTFRFFFMLEIHDIEGKLGALYYGSAYGSLTMIYRRFSVIYSTLCFDSEALFFSQTHRSRDRTVLGSSFHRSVKEQQESKLLQETASTHFPTTHYRLIGSSGLDSYI